VSSASTHQCFDPGVEQLTYSRQPPSGRRISAGRSSDAQRKSAADTVATVSKAMPSVDRATTLAYPRPRSTGRRRRYARKNTPSS
jgi:hypothetical protein